MSKKLKITKPRVLIVLGVLMILLMITVFFAIFVSNTTLMLSAVGLQAILYAVIVAISITHKY